jgi:ribosomal protein S18 acetylase RimI-like enzyme
MTEIRTATATDLPAIVDLWDRAAGPTRHAGRHAEVARLLERDPDALLVAMVDGQLAGALIVGWDGWRCHLYRLAVEPGARRGGVAAALVAAGRMRAVALGAVRLDAMVSPANDGAAGFWEAVGLTRDDHDARWSALL